MAELLEGWGFPLNARKAHYFRRGELISLCSKMMYAGPRENDNHESTDNCAECMRRRQKTEKQGGDR